MAMLTPNPTAVGLRNRVAEIIGVTVEELTEFHVKLDIAAGSSIEWKTQENQYSHDLDNEQRLELWRQCETHFDLPGSATALHVEIALDTPVKVTMTWYPLTHSAPPGLFACKIYSRWLYWLDRFNRRRGDDR